MNIFGPKKIRSSTVLVSKALEHLFGKYRFYLLSIVFALLAGGLFLGLYSLLAYAAVAYLNNTNAIFLKAVTVRLIFISVAYLCMFLIFTYVNGLFIAATRLHKSFRDNCKKVWNIFPRLIGINIILGLVSFLATSPLYGIALTVLTRLPFVTIVAFLLFALFLILLCVAGIYFSTVSILMVDQDLKVFEAIKKNFNLVKGRELAMLGRLAILVVLVALFQFVSIMLSFVPTLSILGTLLILFLVTPFIYSYLNEVYSDIK